MTKTEIHYHAQRGDSADNYQSLEVVKEFCPRRNYIKFSLMETRWRSVDEAVSYLRWAADELEELK